MSTSGILYKSVPPCVMHATFSTWANAWNTDKRYQQDLRDCVLCSSCKGKDEMEHYLICPFGLCNIRRKLKLQKDPRTLARAMLLDCCSGEDLALAAVSLYAVRGVVHKLRAQNCRADSNSIHKHLWEQVRITAMHNRAVASKIPCSRAC